LKYKKWEDSMSRFFGSAIALLIGLAAAGASNAAQVCDVHDFGAKGDGQTKDTRAIQAAIDACTLKGGTVYFGGGRYVSGTLLLQSHVTLKLDHGAVLSGSHDIADYLPGSQFGLARKYGTNIAGEGTLAGLIVAKDVTDVGIEGPGIIDGESDAFMSSTIHAPKDYAPEAVRHPEAFEAAMHDPAYGPFEPGASGRPGVLILFFHATDVHLTGFNLRNSPNWTLVLQDAERVTIRDFSIINNPLMPNNDGIDCMACRDAHISNGTIRTGDDDVVLVNGEDITVSDISMYSRSAAVRLESTQRTVLSHLTIDSNRGLAIFASREISRPTDGVLFSNIVMRTHLMPGHWWGKAEPIYISVQPCEGPCGPRVRNVTFSTIEADAEAGIMLAGVADSPLENIELRDMRLRMVAPDARLAEAIGGNFDSRWTAANPSLGIVKHEIPAVWCNAVKNLTLRDIEIDWGAGAPAYSNAAVACEGYDSVRIDGLVETGSTAKGAKALIMAEGTGLISERLSLRK